MSLNPPPAIAIGTLDIDTLARTIFGEAEGEELAGKVAVAWVIVNRALARRKPLRFICLEPRQFSCWNPGSPRLIPIQEAHLTSSVAFRASFGVACLVLAGEYDDITKGAQFYHTGAVDPRWDDRMIATAQIGRHFFFKEA